MDKIIVKEDGKLFFDNDEKQTSDLNPDILIEIINKALSDDVSFEIEGSQPLASFFRTIQEETKADAEFRKEIDALKIVEVGETEDNNEASPTEEN